MIDYEILRAIWWLFIGVLLVGFAIMDGQDMGVGTLLPFLSKDDTERRCMIILLYKIIIAILQKIY